MIAKAAAIVVAICLAVRAGAASECGFSGRDAVYTNDRPEDMAVLSALGEAIRGAGHECPKVLAAARCRDKRGVAFDVFCSGADFVVRTGTPKPPFAETAVHPAQ